MKWVGWGIAVVIALAAGVWIVGTLLPVAHTATAERVVAGSPDEVWRVMTDVDRLAGWRPGLDSVRRLPERNGLPVWREHASTGSMTLEVVESDPPRRMVARIADEGLPFGGTWTYELTPVDGGTRVIITEDGEVYDPFFRFMARFVFGHEGTMRAYLDGLEARMAGGGP